MAIKFKELEAVELDGVDEVVWEELVEVVRVDTPEGEVRRLKPTAIATKMITTAADAIQIIRFIS